MTTPLLRCRGARIEVNGAVLLDALEVDADGARVVLAGDWEPLFRLWSGSATLTRGSIEVLGVSADRLLRDNRLGIAAAECPLVPSSNAIESLIASGRLLGLGKKDATRRAESVLGRLGLTPLARRRPSRLGRADLRTLSLALAVLGDPPAIAVERPFEGLDDAGALLVESVLGLAAEKRRLLLHLGSPARGGPEARAMERADLVVLLRGGAVIPQAPSFRPPVAEW